MVKISEETVKRIKRNYEGVEQPNECFISDILCNVVDVEVYKVKGTSLPFCDDVMPFWKQKLMENTYVNLFPYLVLCQWQYQIPSSKDLQEWISAFLEEKVSNTNMRLGDIVEEEMHLFISDDKAIEGLSDSFPQIGFLIDTYFWLHNKEIPFFKEHIKRLSDCSDILYNDYICLLIDCLKGKKVEEIVYDIHPILDYCKTIDVIKCKALCFLSLIKYFHAYNLNGERNVDSNTNSNDINSVLSAYPFIGNEIGLAILDFCVQNSKTYNIKPETISAYQEKLYVDSWFFEINKKLKPAQIPYDVDLCKKTNSFNKIIDTIISRKKEFWEKCMKMSLKVVEKVKLENPSDKVTPVKANIINQLHLLCIDEIREIYASIRSLIVMARKEGICLFLSEFRKEEKKKRKADARKLRKKIEFNDDVFRKVYNRFINTSELHILSDFTCNVDSRAYKTYADLIAKRYIVKFLFFGDVINEQALSEEPSEEIITCFNKNIWDNIITQIVWNLCEINFGGQVTSDSLNTDVNTYRTSDSNLSERGLEIFVGDFSLYP